MKYLSLAALAGALAISTMVVAIDSASAARGGIHRGGLHRGGMNRVGMGRVGVGRVGGIGYRRPGLAYRGGYYGAGLGLAAGAALGAAAASTYYDNSGYGAYASAAPAVGWESGNASIGYTASEIGDGSGYFSGSYYGPIFRPGINPFCQ